MMMLKHRYNSASLLSFLLAVGCCLVGFASGSKNKNLLEKIGDIIKDDNGDVPTIDYDAASGTITNEGGKKDLSCDGQLAAALVEAKDVAAVAQKGLEEELAKHKASLETIVELQSNLAQTNSKLVEERDTISKLKETMNESLETEKNRSKGALEALKDQAQKELEALRGQKDGIISSLKDESAKALESVKDNAHQEFEGLKEKKDAVISSLEAKLKMSSKELQETMKMELQKVEEDRDKKVAEITADRDATVAKLTQDMEKAAKDAAEVLHKTMVESSAKLSAVEADRDTQVATLTQKLEDAAMEAEMILEKTVNDAKASYTNQIKALEQKAEEMTAMYEEKLSANKVMIENLEESLKTMMELKAAVERSLEEANAEISHWRQLHAQRSYCNMTHIATDLYDAAAVVGAKSLQVASDQVSIGLEYSGRFVNDKFDEHWPTIAPYYEDIVSGNYRAHLKPHVENIVVPKLRQVSSWSNEVAKPLVLDAIEDGKKAYEAKVTPVVERQYQKAVRMYGNYCRSSLQEFLKASQEVEVLRDHPPPDFLLESWETSCENPRDSMNVAMQSVLALFVIIFYRRLFGLAWSIAAFSLSLVVRLTPLRFFISLKTAKAIESPPPSPTPPTMKAASADSLMQAGGDYEQECDDTTEDVGASIY